VTEYGRYPARSVTAQLEANPTSSSEQYKRKWTEPTGYMNRFMNFPLRQRKKKIKKRKKRKKKKERKNKKNKKRKEKKKRKKKEKKETNHKS
jgi:hypothetical protein